jgi:hypothetical protein
LRGNGPAAVFGGLTADAFFRGLIKGKIPNPPGHTIRAGDGRNPLLEAAPGRQHVQLDRHLSQIARKDDACRRLTTISGVGPFVSLAFKATVDDPTRFKNSKAVAASALIKDAH